MLEIKSNNYTLKEETYVFSVSGVFIKTKLDTRIVFQLKKKQITQY